ncbi:MAG TPA: hypothetical protein VFS63_11650 [Pseudolabrys sp.]|jgi:hypothetical protein|nr:hypothetical protein [Pseudolabrys sp.]
MNEKLVELLVVCLQRLAASGDVEGACQLAGKACAVTRRTDPAAERRFNALLHRLCRPGPIQRNVDGTALEDPGVKRPSAVALD